MQNNCSLMFRAGQPTSQVNDGFSACLDGLGLIS